MSHPPRLRAVSIGLALCAALSLAACSKDSDLADASGLEGAATVVLLVAYAMLAMRLVRLVARVLTVARPSV